jgi:FkbM family methyltransferase
MGLLHGLSPKNGIYIEVGANQPTQISNTYLFYRLGFHGIVIEPNKEMTSLFKHFRPEDIHLEIGCADDSGVSKFKKADVSVLSGFTDDINVVANSQYWTPLLTVDEIWRDVGEKQMVFLLSIDTEGFDLIVLKGAEETLKHTAVVIIETNENDIIEVKTIMLQSGFKLVKTTACNYIWLNEDTAKKICQV